VGHSRSIKVLLADRAGFGRTALATILADTPGVTIVATVADPHLVEATVEETRPDVVVVDDRLLGDERWTGRDGDARVIVVGVDDDPGFAARALRIGAEAWVPKDGAGTLLPLLLIPLEPLEPVSG
jgi:two-component system, NarL family, invasion response regulator UvrY